MQAAKCLSESSSYETVVYVVNCFSSFLDSIIEKNNPQKAAEMLEQAIDLYEADDKVNRLKDIDHFCLTTI